MSKTMRVFLDAIVAVVVVVVVVVGVFQAF